MIYAFFDISKITPEVLEYFLKDFSKDRRQKIDRYVNFEDKAMSAAAYRLLCRALNSKTVELKASANGKPYIDGGILFNISHTKGCVCVATASSDIGIDVEMIKPDCHHELINKIFTKAEREYILCSDAPNRAFFRLWTLKESYFKMTGQGLSAGFLDAEFCLSGQQSCGKIKDAYFKSFEFDLHYISVCAKEPILDSVSTVGIDFLI